MMQSYIFCFIVSLSMIGVAQDLLALDTPTPQVPSNIMFEGTCGSATSNSKSLKDYTVVWEYIYNNVINRIFFQKEAMYCVHQRMFQTNLLSISYQGDSLWSINSGDTAIRISHLEEHYDTVHFVGLAAYIKSAFNSIFSVYAKKTDDTGNEIETVNLRNNDSCLFVLNTTQNGVIFSENGDIVLFAITQNQKKDFIPLFMRISPTKRILVYSAKESIVKEKSASVSIESMIRNNDDTYTCFGYWDDTTRSYFLYKFDNSGQMLQLREWQETGYQVGKQFVLALPSGGYCFIHNKRPSSVQFVPVSYCTILSKDFVPEKEFVIEGSKYFHANNAAVLSPSSIFICGQTTSEQSLETFAPKSAKWDYAFTHLNIETGTQELTTWGDTNVVEQLDYIGSSPMGHLLVGSHTEIPDSNKVLFSLKALKARVSTVAHHDKAVAEVHLYPQPGNSEFTLSFPKEATFPATVAIVNSVGETVLEYITDMPECKIQTHNIAVGSYRVTIRFGTTTLLASLVVHR